MRIPSQLQLAGHVVRNVYYAIGYAEADFPDVTLPSTTTAVGADLGPIPWIQWRNRYEAMTLCFFDTI